MHIDKKQVQQALLAFANLAPDKIAKCLYVNPCDGPECIAGVYFYSLGMSIKDLRDSEGDAASTVAARTGHEFDQDALALLERAQFIQDQGLPWKAAVGDAILVCRERED